MLDFEIRIRNSQGHPLPPPMKFVCFGEEVPTDLTRIEMQDLWETVWGELAPVDGWYDFQLVYEPDPSSKPIFSFHFNPDWSLCVVGGKITSAGQNY